MSESTAPIRVLLVEDDEDDYVLTRDLLSTMSPGGVDLQWVRNYDNARDRLVHGQYDIALVDYRLGAHDGIELIRDAREDGCRLPIILLTGQNDREIDLAAARAGASDFVSKLDVNSTMLERSIRYSIQNAKLEEQRLRLLAERAARAEAEAGSRAKDQFLATLSHELRTPLTPVLIAISAMQNDPSLPELLREDVQMIRRNVELEAKLIDDLLDLTRITRGKLELRFARVDLHEKIRHIIRITEPDAVVKQISIRTELAATHTFMDGDPARLQQILWNLVKNAIKFTPKGGTVTIRTHDDASRISVEVIDTGIGIEADMLPRIFDAFEQGGREITKTHGGLGLGLTISKALADLHHGTLGVQSDGKDKGTIFTLHLPVHPQDVNNVSAQTAPVAAIEPARILFVEDHADTARALSRVLTHRGYKVTQAASVAAAVKAADEESFDLLISDIGLPDGTGLDVMRHVKETCTFPGIAVSGYGMEEDVEAAKRAGFISHLTKPIHPELLLSTVAQAIALKKPA